MLFVLLCTDYKYNFLTLTLTPEISFVHNLFLKYPIVSKFCEQHGNVIAVLCV